MDMEMEWKNLPLKYSLSSSQHYLKLLITMKDKDMILKTWV